MSPRRHAAVIAAGALVVASLGSCASQSDGATLDVYAAASLTDVFTSLADAYEAGHPGVVIRLTFAGSSDLASQINEGAPADVFASANEKQMDAVRDHVDGKSELFASNTLTIVVPKGNPRGVTRFVSLADPGLKVVVCAPEVPCGAATATIEEALGVKLTPVSELTNVTDVLGSVSSGEADAGLVYVTDLSRANGVEGIPFAGADAAVTRYPIAALTDSRSPKEARGFVDYVLGPQGRAALTEAGFGAPDVATSYAATTNPATPHPATPNSAAAG